MMTHAGASTATIDDELDAADAICAASAGRCGKHLETALAAERRREWDAALKALKMAEMELGTMGDMVRCGQRLETGGAS